MKTQWMVATHGDPIGAVRQFIKSVWLNTELDGMVVSLSGDQVPRSKPYILASPGELDRVNPFKPLMRVNTAKYLPELLDKYPQVHLGVILRPCEMRALVEMVKNDSFAFDRLLTVCIDCLGTYPAEDFEWRSERKGSSKDLTAEALHFARAGGILAYRYRSACQMCSSPQAKGAHLNIGVLGLPVRQHALIETRDAITSDWLQMNQLADRPADPELVKGHDRTLANLVERNTRTRERIIRGLPNSLPSDVDGLIRQFESCGACQDCMDSCPICEVDPPRRGKDGRYFAGDITRWMLSCAGCGMCERACPIHLPLSAIFHHIKQRLAEPSSDTGGQPLEESISLI